MRRYNEYGFPILKLTNEIGIEVVPGGKKRTYLWVGENEAPLTEKPRRVFVGTSGGTKTLRKFCLAILDEIGYEE